jgi:hypothetical protein
MTEGVQILYAKNRAAAQAVLDALAGKGIPASLNINEIDPKRPGLLVWTDSDYSETKSKALKYTTLAPRYPLTHVNIGSKELPSELREQRHFSFANLAALADVGSAEIGMLAKYYAFQNSVWQRIIRLWFRWHRNPYLIALTVVGSALSFIATQMGLKAINICTYAPESCGRLGFPGYPSVSEQKVWAKIPYRADKTDIDAYLEKYGRGYYAEQARTALFSREELVKPEWIDYREKVPIGSLLSFQSLGHGIDPAQRKQLEIEGAATCKSVGERSDGLGEPFKVASSLVETRQAGLANVTCIGKKQVQRVQIFYRIASKAP